MSERVYCQNCKHRFIPGLVGYPMCRASLAERETYDGVVNDHSYCSDKNSHNACEDYVPKLWLRIRNALLAQEKGEDDE